jgi:hypothetical protein
VADKTGFKTDKSNQIFEEAKVRSLTLQALTQAFDASLHRY